MNQFLQSIPVGARYMVLSGLGFSLMGVFVKMAAARGIPVLEIVAARAFISAVLTGLDIRRKKISFLGNRRDLLLARGVVGAFALICVYYALSHLPFAEATVLQYLHPMFTVILAFLFLKERLTLATAFCITFSFLGLLVIAQPEFLFGKSSNEYSMLAIIAAVGGALGSAGAYVLVRKLSATEDPSVIIFYFPVVALPLSLILLGDNYIMPQGWGWVILLLVGICTQVGQIGLTKAMQTETAGKATSFSYLQVVFAILFGIAFFDEIPTAWVIIGALFIVFGAFFNLKSNK